MIEIANQATRAWSQLGITLEVQQGTLDTWTAQIVGEHKMPHLAAMSWGGAPDRLEPDYFLTEFLYSKRTVKGGLNYGNYTNPRYDQVIEAQRQEMDPTRRQKLVWDAQATSAAENPSLVLFHRDYIQVYNSTRWEGVVPVVGSGIAMPYIPWSYLKMRAKTPRKLLKVTSIYDLHTLNPFATPEVHNSTMLRWIYPAFVIRDADTNLMPWAAESWKVVNPTTIDVTLRDGMKFHDGKPVTVDDAKFTFDYILQWKFPALSRVVDSVESTEVVDRRTLRFRLLRPFAPFVASVLGFTFIAPRHVWEKVPGASGLKSPADWPNEQPMGSGPYTFGEWRKGEYLFLKANKAHWAAPQLDGVYWLVVPSLENQIGMLENGESDMLGWFVDAKQGERLAQHKDLKVVRAGNHGLHEIRLNCTTAPTSDPKFRLALQHATDRKQLLDIVFGGAGTVANNTFITPKQKFWSNPSVTNPPFGVDRAREVLKAAGYTWDADGKLRYPKA
jgi:peptide/nickel transport system substrate-binding protein